MNLTEEKRWAQAKARAQADAAAYPARFIAGVENPDDIKLRPDTMLTLPDSETRIGWLDPATMTLTTRADALVELSDR